MTVEFADGEPNGLASLLGELLRTNLERHPERRALLRPGTAGLDARDAGVAATVRMHHGRLRIANGLDDRPHIVVRADSEVLLALPAVPLRFGLPDVASSDGRDLLRGLAAGRITVRGLLRHPGVLLRLTRLLSVR